MENQNTVTQEQIEDILHRSKCDVHTFGNKTTVVHCTLPNGFVIVESSSCVDPSNYNQELGAKICLDRIKNKIWELEGYKLQDGQLTLYATDELILKIAIICHEANRVYCKLHGDHSQKAWEEAEDWQRESAVNGVKFVIDNPAAPASANHDNWLKEKRETGWKRGPVKDPVKKEHPCCVPYELLPVEQQIKDSLFRGIVLSFMK